MYDCEQIVYGSVLGDTLYVCEQVVYDKQLDWAPFWRMGILDFTVLLYFVIHCLWPLDFGVLSNKMQRHKKLTVAAIYKSDRLAVVHVSLKSEVWCYIFVSEQQVMCPARSSS